MPLQLFNQLPLTNPLARNLLLLALILVLTWLAARVGGWLALKMLNTRTLDHRHQIGEKRLLTLRLLVRSAVNLITYIIGFVVILFALGVPSGSILTALGLFSAAFGLGARPLISDYLAGITFIFEDQFSVGEKVEMLGIIGVVEAVDLRITQLRSNTGELYIVPNGDVRVVRNLSRGLFSIATIKVKVATEDLSRALDVLAHVADTAQAELPDLVERPEFLSEEGTISANVELTLSAKATYGRGARLRTRLMALVTDALKAAEVKIIS